MSQVLTGILGVLLFILLALAGAVYLGQRFQDSANNGRATATVQVNAQVSSAANMYNAQEGLAAPDIATMQARGYLKSIPVNPTGVPAGASVLYAVPTITSLGSPAFPAVAMDLAGNAEEICLAIQRQSYGGTATIPTAPPAGPTGCFERVTGTYTAYSRI